MDTLNAPRLAGSDSETLTIAAPLFVHETFVPRLATTTHGPIRCLALPAALITAYSRDNVFDAALMIGTDDAVPAAWSRVQVGEVRYGLFASPGLARRLGPTPSLEDLLAIPFVGPVFVSRQGELTPGNDRCPIPRSERTIGHEAETVGLACRIAAETEHLVYGPVAAATPFVVDGTLVEVSVAGWAQTDPLYLACNGDSVSANAQDLLATVIRASFETLRHESGVVELGGSAPQALRRLASS